MKKQQPGIDVGIRERLEASAHELEKKARTAASSNLSRQLEGHVRSAADAVSGSDSAKRASDGFRELKAIVRNDSGEPLSAELFLVSLVRAVRLDDGFEGRSIQDVYEEARNRRRLLGVMSFGAGPLRGVATQLCDLYCEIAIVGDLANTYHLPLDDEHVAAHMLALWGIAEDPPTGLMLVLGRGERPLTAVLADPLKNKAVEYLPKQLTRGELTASMWRARGIVGDAKQGMTSGKGDIRGIVFAGKRTNQLIKRAGVQLQLQTADGKALIQASSGDGEWRPDPTGRHTYRFHQGDRWTYHVSDNGETSLDGTGLSELDTDNV